MYSFPEDQNNYDFYPQKKLVFLVYSRYQKPYLNVRCNITILLTRNFSTSYYIVFVIFVKLWQYHAHLLDLSLFLSFWKEVANPFSVLNLKCNYLKVSLSLSRCPQSMWISSARLLCGHEVDWVHRYWKSTSQPSLNSRTYAWDLVMWEWGYSCHWRKRAMDWIEAEEWGKKQRHQNHMVQISVYSRK